MLRSKRKSLMLNQAQAAKLLGISHVTLSKIENKHHTDLNIFLVNKICKLYNLNFIDLVEWLKFNNH